MLEEADAIEQLSHESPRSESGVADEGATNAMSGQRLESRARPLEREYLAIENLILERSDQLRFARGLERDAQGGEHGARHVHAVERDPTVPQDLMLPPGIPGRVPSRPFAHSDRGRERTSPRAGVERLRRLVE